MKRSIAVFNFVLVLSLTLCRIVSAVNNGGLSDQERRDAKGALCTAGASAIAYSREMRMGVSADEIFEMAVSVYRSSNPDAKIRRVKEVLSIMKDNMVDGEVTQEESKSGKWSSQECAHLLGADE